MSLNGKRIAVLSSLIVTFIALSAITPRKPATLAKTEMQLEKSLPLAPIEELGRRLFFDETLSTPPGQSCATCHDSAAAFAQPVRDLPVSRGAHADRFGSRNDLPVSYAAFVPPLHKDPEEKIWVGGLFWDGRANTLAEQAMMPPLNPLEMAARDVADIAGKLRSLEYAKLFIEVFGPEALKADEQAFKNFGLAIEAFEKTKQFSPFDSKYDAYLKGQTTLTEQELRGLAVFEAEDKGNCAACHPSRPGEDGKPPLFTDFTFDNLGVPKNPENPFYLLPKELNPDGFHFVDYGLAVTVKDDAEKGKFRVPTLRNIALTGPYAHNGFFKTLFSIVAFYNTRDVAPWPAPEVKENVNTEELGNLKLSNQEVEDIVAFMLTLTDGWKIPPR